MGQRAVNAEFSWLCPRGTADVDLLKGDHPRDATYHIAADTYAIDWIMDGTVSMQHRGNSWSLQSGDIVVAEPLMPVIGSVTSARLHHCVALAPASAIRRSVSMIRTRGPVSPFVSPIVRSPAADRAARTFYLSSIEYHDPAKQQLAWLDLIGALCDPQLELIAQPFRVEPRAVRLVREYLREKATERVSLEDLALVAGLSKYHLARLFRSATGMSPHRYHLGMRTSRARSLLRRGHTALETALAVGFVDQSHFTRVFKQTFGLTPGEYGRLCRQSCDSGVDDDDEPDRIEPPSLFLVSRR